MFLLFFILWVSFALFAFIFHSFSCPFSIHFILFSFLFLFPALSSPSCISPNCLVRFIVFYAFLSFYFFVRCNFSQCKTNAPEKKTDLSRFKWSHGALLDLVSSRGASWAFMVFHVNSCELMGPHESRRDVFLAEKTKQESPDQKWTPNWKTLRLYNHQCKRDIAWSFPTVQNKVTNLTSEILKAIQPGLYNARPHRCIQWKLKAYPARADNWNQISSPNLTSVRTCSWGAFLLRLLLKHV